MATRKKRIRWMMGRKSNTDKSGGLENRNWKDEGTGGGSRGG